MDHPLRISIADDDVRACDALTKSLRRNSSVEVVDHAYDGMSALQAIAEHMPDVALLDVVMPSLDALGILEELEAMRLIKVPRVLLFVSEGQESIAERALRCGAEGILMRPVDGERVIAAAQRLFEAGESGTARFVEAGSEQDLKIVEALDTVGVPGHLKGYAYLRDAMRLVLMNVELLGAMTKTLYPMIATRNQSTNSRVERSIRHAVERAWDAGNMEAIHTLFGNSVSSDSGKPTNGEFIARMTEYVRLST